MFEEPAGSFFASFLDSFLESAFFDLLAFFSF